MTRFAIPITLVASMFAVVKAAAALPQEPVAFVDAFRRSDDRGAE